MVRIHPERLPPSANKKLHPRNTGPFKVLKKLSSSAYTLKLPSDIGISPTFNVADLTLYRGHDNKDDFDEQIITLPAASPPSNKIIDVLDDQIVSIRREGFQKFLICWQNRSISDAAWITATDFQRLNPDLYEHYQAINLPESSSFKPGRVDAIRRSKRGPRPT